MSTSTIGNGKVSSTSMPATTSTSIGTIQNNTTLRNTTTIVSPVVQQHQHPQQQQQTSPILAIATSTRRNALSSAMENLLSRRATLVACGARSSTAAANVRERAATAEKKIIASAEKHLKQLRAAEAKSVAELSAHAAALRTEATSIDSFQKSLSAHDGYISSSTKEISHSETESSQIFSKLCAEADKLAARPIPASVSWINI
jgi:hypothetical protein